MSDSAARIVLHEAKTTFLLWVIPLFLVAGCLLISVNVTLPLLSNPLSDSGFGLWVSIGAVVLANLALPVGAGLMFFFIPRITTTLDAQRRVVAMAFRRPLRTSVKEYRLDDIADVRPVYLRRRRYTLALVLKSGENIRLDYFLLPDPKPLHQRAEQIKAQLAPYWQPTAGG